MKPLTYMRAIRDAGDLPSSAVVVAWAIALRANRDTSVCDPSVATIAADCGVSPRTVNTMLTLLCERGWLIRLHRYQRGRQTSNVYRLTSPQPVDNPRCLPVDNRLVQGVQQLQGEGAAVADTEGAAVADKGLEELKWGVPASLAVDNPPAAAVDDVALPALIADLARSSRIPA